jgi:4-amino-4-deoxy-L-arabinose transferase-like glycosyltransferase
MNIHKWAIALLVWGFAFRTLAATFLYPGFDEAYYYIYTLHPDWSYFDHPPLVALVTSFGIWLTGDVTQFSIRFGTVILYTGTLWFLYLTSAKLFDKRTATLTLAIATSIPIFQVAFGFLTLPDSPLMFFWSATLCVAAHEFFPTITNKEFSAELPSYKPTARIAIIGLLVGCACLGKYHGFLLGFGLILFCLFSPRHRSALFSPWTIAGLGLFCAAISPIVIWNAQHSWASFRFQGARAVPNGSYSLEGLLVTFLVGVGYLFPTFGFPLWFVNLKAVGQIFKKTSRKKFQGSDASTDNFSADIGAIDLESLRLKQLMILAVSLPIFLGFTLMGGYRQVLPSWHMPGFYGATLLLGQQAAIAQLHHPKGIRNWLWGSGVVVVTIMLIALMHVHSGIFQKGGDRAIAGGFWAAKDDASTQMIDVAQLRQGFKDSAILKDALAKSDFVFSNNFFITGQIGMAIAPLGQKPITCFDQDLRGFAYWSTAEQWVGKNALYVSSELFQEPLIEMSTGLLPSIVSKYGNYFEAIDKIGEVPILRGGETVQKFHVYRATKMLRPYPRPYGN